MGMIAQRALRKSICSKIEGTGYKIKLCQYDDIYEVDPDMWYVELIAKNGIVVYQAAVLKDVDTEDEDFKAVRIRAYELCRKYLIEEIERCNDAYSVLGSEMEKLME